MENKFLHNNQTNSLFNSAYQATNKCFKQTAITGVSNQSDVLKNTSILSKSQPMKYPTTSIQQAQNKNQNDKKEDQKKEEQKKEDPKDQNNDQQPPQDQQKDQKQSPSKQYTKEELERIMQALNQDDKNVQEKVNKQKVQAAGAEAEKDW